MIILKNVYCPDEEDILEWCKGDLVWPEYDWDGYVMGSECDDIIFKFANTKDTSDPRDEYLQRFFVVVLYYFVGNYFRFHKSSEYSQGRLNKILEKVDENSTPLLQEWKNNTLNLISGKLIYDNDFWFYNKLIYPERHCSHSNTKHHH